MGNGNGAVVAGAGGRLCWWGLRCWGGGGIGGGAGACLSGDGMGV